MILTLLSFDEENNTKAFEEFQSICRQRYALLLSQPFQRVGDNAYYTAMKPFNAIACPYLAIDLHVAMRRSNARVVFVHDMLDFAVDGQARIDLEGPGFDAARRMLAAIPDSKASMQFRGFGQRIDIALNALSLLYIDMLATLTKVETEVFHHLRDLQFQQFSDPTVTRTYGLQKVVAQRLDKSPVAIHKSLRSSRYQHIADTAQAMRAIIT